MKNTYINKLAKTYMKIYESALEPPKSVIKRKSRKSRKAKRLTENKYKHNETDPTWIKFYQIMEENNYDLCTFMYNDKELKQGKYRSVLRLPYCYMPEISDADQFEELRDELANAYSEYIRADKTKLLDVCHEYNHDEICDDKTLDTIFDDMAENTISSVEDKFNDNVHTFVSNPEKFSDDNTIKFANGTILIVFSKEEENYIDNNCVGIGLTNALQHT